MIKLHPPVSRTILLPPQVLTVPLMGEAGNQKKSNTKKHKHQDDHHHHHHHKKHHNNEQQKQQEAKEGEAPPPTTAGTTTKAADAHFKPSSDVKGVRFGSQLFIVKSFTVRRAAPLELLRLLDVVPQQQQQQQNAIGTSSTLLPFPSATGYVPTNFTILAHHAWHTLTLGLGTRKSKVVVFVFETEAMRAAADRLWPPVLPLGEVNRKLVRGLQGCEMARFKFRKGALTFYVYAVRRAGAAAGYFPRAEDLRRLLEAVAALKDFLDHTAMLATPKQRSITFSSPHVATTTVVH